MSAKEAMSLIELQSLIANCAIENCEHDKAYKRCCLLVDKFGPFRRVDFDTTVRILYNYDSPRAKMIE